MADLHQTIELLKSKGMIDPLEIERTLYLIQAASIQTLGQPFFESSVQFIHVGAGTKAIICQLNIDKEGVCDIKHNQQTNLECWTDQHR